MRIAIVSRAENVSGKEIMTLELGIGLRSAGHAVQYLTSHWNDGTYQQRLNDLDFKTSCLDLGSISATLRWDSVRTTLRQLLRLPGLWVDYRRFLRQERPEHVIHTSWHHLLLLLPLLSPRRDWYWIHEVLPDKAHYSWVFMRLARRLRGFVAVSNTVRNSLLKAGVPDQQVRVIHNGLRDLAQGEPRGTPHDGGKRIGIVGQVEEWKGHHVLLDAFAQLASKYPETALHVFGSGSVPYVKRLKRQAEALGISSRVIWHGFVPERERIYMQLDVCVVPVPVGATEALPTIAIEAAFCSLPVLGSRCGGLLEIIEDGTTGFLVEPGDVKQLSTRLEQLLADGALRHRMGLAARQLATARFGHERFVTDFVRMLAATPIAAKE